MTQVQEHYLSIVKMERIPGNGNHFPGAWRVKKMASLMYVVVFVFIAFLTHDRSRESKTVERAQAGWGFWLRWVLASAVGGVMGGAMGVGVIIFMFLMALGGTEFGSVFVASFGTVFGIVVGALIGIAQWLVLRRHISQAGWWVLASTAGGAMGGAVSFLGIMTVGGAEAEAVVKAGASVGIAQWPGLRRHVSRAGWWVLASSVGWAVIMGGGFTTGSFVSGISVGMITVGMITGGALVWLLRQPAPKGQVLFR
jgi:hypothetical protein